MVSQMESRNAASMHRMLSKRAIRNTNKKDGDDDDSRRAHRSVRWSRPSNYENESNNNKDPVIR